MEVFKATHTVEGVQGEWCTYAVDPKTGEKVELQIRPLPAGEDRRMSAKYFGRERKVTWSEEGRTQTSNVQRSEEFVRERAILALVETRGAETRVMDAKSAEAYGKVLGEALEVGQLVTLDGHWTQELKALVFADSPELAVWCSEKATQLRTTAAQEEEKKEEA